MKSFSKAVALQAAVALGAIAVSSSAHAQINDPRAQVDEAFRALLAAPGDLNRGYGYARALINAGNYEGGVAALERMLLDPNASPSIRLELAVLYYRLGSYDMAASYAQQAAADPRLEPSLRASAERVLADSQDRTKTHRITGSIMSGLRVQSNPMGAPSNTTPTTEADIVLNGRLEHTWDFGAQNGAALVSTLSGYASRYFDGARYNTKPGKTDPQDLFAIEATSGVRFAPAAASAPTFTLRPYLLLGDAFLTGHQYFATFGGGIDASYRSDSGKVLLDATYEARGTDYNARNDVFEANKQGGLDNILRLRAGFEVAPGQLLIGEVVGRNRNTDREYFDFNSGELRMTYLANYGNPFGWDDRAWTSSVYAGPTYRKYGGANAVIDPDTRKDLEWRVGLTNSVPLSDSWSMFMQAEYTRNDSNIASSDYNNALGLVGVMWRY